MMFRTALPARATLIAAILGAGAVLLAIFAALLFYFRGGLHREIRRTVIGRDSAVLAPVARQQIAVASRRVAPRTLRTPELLDAVLPTAQQDGMLAVAVFNEQGDLLRAVPDTLLFAELATTDYVTLLGNAPITRYHAEFPLDRYFRGAQPGATAPVLEVLLPLVEPGRAQPSGFAQYYIDARSLAGELAAIDSRLDGHTWAILGAGAIAAALVLGGACVGLLRAQRLVAERNERLARANLELTLAAKASALGQITSHLIHGLQGSVASLRSAVASAPAAQPDWESAAFHAERMQSLITEVVALLADMRTGATYEISADELAALIRQRGEAHANPRGVQLDVVNRTRRPLDNHRGSLLCLIAANLVQNAARASAPGQSVVVELTEVGDEVQLHVTDRGTGVAPELLPRLFTPGASGGGGTGLGLSISRLLARQMEGDLELVSTGPDGTIFRARVAIGRLQIA
ncbi:MAG: sensor histidine kinase [Opitutae bacterium]|nr:sensor histidine kinase [Opitutae bacterium]